MAKLKDDTRKAMLKLGFNVVILPKDQNLSDWYADDYASKYMPEEYVTKLANSRVVTVRHFLPSLGFSNVSRSSPNRPLFIFKPPKAARGTSGSDRAVD